MAVPMTWVEIKAATEVGDSPNNATRADVWDSVAYYVQQAEAKAQAAVNAVAATLPLCMGALRVEISSGYLLGSGAHTATILRQQSCTFLITHLAPVLTSNPASGPKAYKAVFQIDVTFAAPAANTTYTSNFALTNKTTGGCRFLVELPYLYLQPGTTNEPVWDNVTFMIWP